MRVSVRHNSIDIAEFNQIDVHGRSAAGGYGFTFILRGNSQGCESPILVFDIKLSIAISTPSIMLLTSIPSSTQLLQFNQYPNNNQQLPFEVVLTKEQINALEEYRQNKELSLNLGLKVLISGNDTVQANYDCENFVIPREQWLQALSNSGFRKTLLFEIPLPASAEEVEALYSKAQEFIETGHYRDAVMQCRHIIEQVEALRDDKKQAIEANKRSQSRIERQNMSSRERMLSLREHVKSICHLGAHGGEEFTRSQSKTILAMTMSILSESTVGIISPTINTHSQSDCKET